MYYVTVGHAPIAQCCDHSAGGPQLGKSKIQSAPIALKIGTGMFSSTPDTMAMLILRKNDVITLPRPFTHLLREK